MIKALSAIAIAACIAAALTVLPGFAPQVEASVPQALAKADRLDINTVAELLAEGLAELRGFLPARSRQQDHDQASPAGNRRPHAIRRSHRQANPMVICGDASHTGIWSRPS